MLFLLFSLLLLTSSTVHADDRNLLPKYGGLPKAEWQKQADEAFLKATDEEYHGDRIKASQDSAMRGWQYLQQRNLEYAMQRFNQAWLLNPKNGVALWGMAAIMADTGKYDDSLKLFAEAEEFVGNDLYFSVDYARTVSVAGVAQKDEALIKDAFHRFESIYRRAPQNTRNLQNWAVTLYSLERYPEAWEKVKLAEATPGKAMLDPKFLAELEKHMPRPKD